MILTFLFHPQLVVSDGHVTIDVYVSSSSAHVESHEAVEAEFLKHPEEAAEAIRIAMMLARQAPPVQMMPARY